MKIRNLMVAILVVLALVGCSHFVQETSSEPVNTKPARDTALETRVASTLKRQGLQVVRFVGYKDHIQASKKVIVSGKLVAVVVTDSEGVEKRVRAFCPHTSAYKVEVMAN